MKCFRCGTEYTGIECPTCAQKRLSEERNRLLEKQNQEIEKQRRESEQQTKELERQNRLLEQDRWDRNYEKQQELDKEKFHARFEELSQYAVERGLTPVFVCAKYKTEDLLENILEDHLDDLGDDINIDDQGRIIIAGQGNVIKSIYTDCMKDFLTLISSLDSDDRILKASDYGMCFTPEFKLGDLQQIKKTHNFEFVIVPYDNGLTLFSLDMIKDQNLKGYNGKRLQIGEFNYLMLLKDKKEADDIAKILSETSRKYNYVKNEIKKSVENYINNNPKPKSYDMNLDVPKTSSAIFVILVIIGAIIGGFIGKFVFQMDSIFVILIFAFFGAVGFGSIGFKIEGAVEDNKKNKKYKKEKKKEEEAKKQIENWRNEMKRNLKKCLENISGYIKKKPEGNFIGVK
jgi:DNA-directed RNA polymerase subunit RPC12/RpoP